MKKIIYLGIFLLCIIGMIPVYATETPYYDQTYNENKGAFYANGTDITIEDKNGETIIQWDGNEETVNSTVTVFGGGKEGKHFAHSNITMNGGTVSAIVGGGIAIQDSTSTVNTTNITVNDGTVSSYIAGGGILYAEVNHATITINGGNVQSIIGGGIANISIDQQMHTVGSHDNPQESPNRVQLTDIIINNGAIPPANIPSGTISGGGQWYSYVGNANITIHDGDLTKAVVIAGSVEGYVEKANVEMTGGTLGYYESIDKGITKDATVTVIGGTIENFAVASKEEATLATGKMDRANVYLVGGNITNLEAGNLNSAPLVIDKEHYQILQTKSFQITSSTIPESERTQLSFSLLLYPKQTTMRPGFSRRFGLIVITSPEGYEYLFQAIPCWQSNKPEVASVTDDGIITAESPGTAEITVTYLDQSETAEIIVEESKITVPVLQIILPIILALLVFLWIYMLACQRRH